MTVILAIRHAPCLQNSGRDPELSPEGIQMATRLKLGGFDRAYSSEYLRARQTIQLLGYKDFIIEPSLNELQCPMNFGTDAEYIEHIFQKHLEEVRAKATLLKTLILSLPPDSSALLVSHGVTLTALYVQVRRGVIEPGDWHLVEFEPLNGFNIWVAGQKVKGTEMFRT